MATISVEIVEPPRPPGPLAWLRENLFSNWFNSILTMISLVIVIWGSISALRWVFFSADWTPVARNPLLFLVGQYPRESLWRVGASLAIVSFLAGVSWRQWGGTMRAFVLLYAAFLFIGVFWSPKGETLTLPMRIFLASNLGFILLGYLIGGLKLITPRLVVIAWALSIVITLVLLNGFSNSPILSHVPTGLWGGLMVTLILAVGGIALSFPIGVILALGRRSSLPVVKWFSIIFIEVVRGVPLIGILFLSSVTLPLFLPQDVRVDLLLRALVGMTLFSAAYMAENVRGGLAAIPPGQEEAAKALGLNNFQITILIILPQALRAVIPPIVGQFISLFKDTTLASGVAVLEFLAIGRSIVQSNPAYVSKQAEVLVFIAAVFWIFCYMLSYASLRLEAALGVGER
jgi:general L-amino acid transport system permease protein